MVIDLKGVEIGAIINREFSFKIDENLLADRNAEIESDVKFTGWYSLADSNTFAISGSLKVNVRGVCDSCGDCYTRVYELPYKATFRVTPELDEYKFDGVSADIDKSVADAILLELPTRMLCKDDCKGICTICGQNLNKGKCNCNKDGDGDSPFAVLKDIKF